MWWRLYKSGLSLSHNSINLIHVCDFLTHPQFSFSILLYFWFFIICRVNFDIYILFSATFLSKKPFNNIFLCLCSRYQSICVKDYFHFKKVFIHIRPAFCLSYIKENICIYSTEDILCMGMYATYTSLCDSTTSNLLFSEY